MLYANILIQHDNDWVLDVSLDSTDIPECNLHSWFRKFNKTNAKAPSYRNI